GTKAFRPLHQVRGGGNPQQLASYLSHHVRFAEAQRIVAGALVSLEEVLEPLKMLVQRSEGRVVQFDKKIRWDAQLEFEGIESLQVILLVGEQGRAASQQGLLELIGLQLGNVAAFLQRLRQLKEPLQFFDIEGIHPDLRRL